MPHEPIGLHLRSPQPNNSLHHETTDTGLVHLRSACLRSCIRWYEIILRGNRGTWVQTNCPELSLSRALDTAQTLNFLIVNPTDAQCHNVKGKGSPYSTAQCRVLELIPVLGSQPAGDVSYKPGSRLPLLSARRELPSQPLRRLLPILHNRCEQFA